MRISDGSSDVCSSDLVESARSLSLREAITNVIRHANANAVEVDCETTADGGVQLTVSDDGRGGVTGFGNGLSGLGERMAALGGSLKLDSPRSEEHTSELQSLMRISYAVFCLKKKNNTNK